MKHLIIIIIVTTVFGFTNILCAQTTYFVKSDNGLNLRKGAGSDQGVVISIPSNAKVKVLNKGNDW
ncbi:MAG: SH3 domain-containing protein, partial [Bacteroidia bacterium]|nr:SH3 domain-containing protein [Bacteroidia bacterium]